jgi:hypothetical protein
VAETLLRAANAGVDAFAFWCFMNPNTIDGHWRIVGIEDGRLVRAAYPGATYGLLSRLVRPGSSVQPLASRPEADRRAHLHAAAFTAPTGERALFLVNDHPGEEREALVALPPGWGDLPASCRRVGRDALAVPAAVPAATVGDAVRVDVPPMSLLAFHDAALDAA